MGCVSKTLRVIKNQYRQHLLVIATFISVLLGIAIGSILRYVFSDKKFSSREVMYIKFIGELFLRILKSLILPLIVTSLITGISSLNLKLSRKIGARAIAFYITTTFCSVILGMSLVTAIRPGSDGTVDTDDVKPIISKNITTVDTLLDLVRNIFPPNLVQLTIEQTTTNLTPNKKNPNSTGNFH